MVDTPTVAKVPIGDYIQFRHVRPDGTSGFDLKVDLNVFGGDGNQFEKMLKTLESIAGMFINLSQTVDQTTTVAVKTV